MMSQTEGCGQYCRGQCQCTGRLYQTGVLVEGTLWLDYDCSAQDGTSCKKKTKQVVKKTIHCKVDAETAYRHSVIFEAKHQTAKCRLMRELSRTSQLPYTLVTGKL